MKNLETDQAACEEIKKQIEQQRAKVEEVRKESESKAVELEKDVAEIQTEWNAAAKDIPGEALQVFERVAETYDGEAMAEIEQPDNNGAFYSCGGCFMGIPAEVVNVLSGTRDDLIRCTSCTRILYLKDKL
jgi:predicted  nucleic acid-binding Zn-ribbon protein